MAISACGSSGKADPKEAGPAQDLTPYGKYEEPVEFTIGRGVYSGGSLPEGMTIEDNTGTKYVEEMANVHAKVAWESQDTAQKIALSISTGDIPDVMIVNRQQFKQLVDNDLIADMTEVYEKTASDHLKEIYDSFGDIILDQITVDGKLMGLPLTSIGGQQDLLWIRKDWLEKSGKDLPKTKQEVYELAEEFVKQDFAGNGETVGLSMGTKIAGTYNSGYSLNPIFYANQSYPRQWIEKDGETVYGTIQPETKETLEELSQLYKDGVIDKQFAVRKTEDLSALVSSGKLGMLFYPWWAPYGDIQQAIANDPEADWIPISAPEDEEGNINVTQNDPIGGVIVVRKDFSNPEAIVKSMNLSQDFIYQLTPEAKEFTQQEIPDMKTRWDHILVQVPAQLDFNDITTRIYTALTEAIDDGSSEDLRLDLLPVYNNYEILQKDGPKSDLTAWGDVKARLDGEKASFDERIKKIDVNFFDTTPTMDTAWTNLVKLEDEMFVRIITGEEPIEYFDEFVSQWNKIGGETITKEVNEVVKGQ
ncbi:extracellular solute-binding protein [Enterococcus alcedinis]|uniref:extracellular solute-binding protein n=1 Tax=Enterococcus alcedinis TaxID=1274384 RepID=UPI00360B3D11